LRALADEYDALLIYDEVQCGVGRSGKLWGYMSICVEADDRVEPDIMTAAKPLAGGLPMGAILVRQKVADVMQKGDHGSTFGGGPVVASAALAVMEQVETKEFLSHVIEMGDYLITLEPVNLGSKMEISDQGRGPIQAKITIFVKGTGEYRLNGWFKSRDPNQQDITEALRLIGRPDSSGRYWVRINSRLRGWRK
ncbi:MAG: type II secretion system protein N, partial [Gammaproteobacteria bacterium]